MGYVSLWAKGMLIAGGHDPRRAMPVDAMSVME